MSNDRVQLITRDGEPEYAVLPYADYLALLQRAQGREAPLAVAPLAATPPPRSSPENAAATARPFQAAELVRLRKRAGLSQGQLAKVTKLGLVNLIQIETGQRQPGAAMRAELARALGVAEL